MKKLNNFSNGVIYAPKTNTVKKPIILIVNGRPGAGKDTFAEMLNKHGKVKKMSIIDLTKELATLAGWDGLKNDRSRRFLSDLKGLIDDFNDGSFYHVMNQVVESVNSGEYDYILIDARRMQDIERMKREFGAKSVYIYNKNVKHIPTNRDDMEARVGGSHYDITLQNNGTLMEFDVAVELLHCDLQAL